MLKKIKKWLANSLFRDEVATLIEAELKKQEKEMIYESAENVAAFHKHRFVSELAAGYAKWDGINSEYADAYRLLLNTFTTDKTE